MSVRAALRLTIGLKIFGIAVGLLVLMSAVAWVNLHMTRTVDAQLVVVDEHYVPAVITLAQAHIHKLEESSTSRRLASALLRAERPEADPRSVHRFRRAMEPWALEALAFLGASELADAVEEARRNEPAGPLVRELPSVDVLGLARDPAKLAAAKEKAMTARTSALFDAVAFARDFERVLLAAAGR